jgi:hypothetical protein
MSVTITKSEAPDDLDPPDSPEEEPQEETGNPDAPYGYESDGTTPKAPYGYRKDGKPAKKRGRAKGSTGTSGGSSRSLAGLREPLIQRLVEYIGGPIMLVSPIAAAVWDDRVEQTADSILVLAARSPRWKKWVERLIAGSAGGDLGITFVGVATGILVDTGRLSPEGKVQDFFKINQIYAELYGAYQTARETGDNARGLYAEVS